MAIGDLARRTDMSAKAIREAPGRGRYPDAREKLVSEMCAPARRQRRH